MSYDTIIVGAGPAGSVLAARLSEDSERTVLLIEAGPDFGADQSAWPAELLQTLGPEINRHSWGYEHRPMASGRRLSLPRARVVGGCSSINSCIWLRGSRADYDGWEDLGNPGWGYDDLLPYFRIAETDLGGPVEIHGQSGPVRVSRATEDELSRIDIAWMDTAGELGFERVADLNADERQYPCVGLSPKNVVAGQRLNAALSYLSMARSRPNFTLLPDTPIARTTMDGKIVRGVEAVDGRQFEAREVIICAGAYASPALLLRSGIGPAEHLRELGLPIVHDLPGVGANLMDHPQIAPYTSNLTTFVITPGVQPESRRFIQTMIKARSSQVDSEIDLHLYPRESLDEATGRWLFRVGVSLQYSRSRGQVRLSSTDPLSPPIIDHNYFSEPADLEALTDGVQLAFRLADTRPLSDMLEGPVRPGVDPRDREGLQAIIQDEVGTTFHPSSSCAMGPAGNPLAVVDAAGRVHGIAGLRVVDASIFPTGPRCNLHYPTVAVAERMAAIIRER